MTALLRLLAGFLATGVLLGACTSGEAADDATTSLAATDPVLQPDPPFEPDAPDPSDTPATTGAADETVDPSLDRDDVDCSEDGLGSDELTEFTTAHVVVGGVLGARCFGEDAPGLIDAWNTLAAITPRLQLADLGLFGAFESAEEGEEVTLAFVNTLDDDGTLFQMSVNLETFREDEEQALMTMAHEFTHVFTALPSQIDRSAETLDDCSTYDNGEGCYLSDALMFQWIELFWGGGLIDEVDPFAEATAEDGQERCDTNAGFFGAYGASTPEEDFAEAFAAFVFDIAPDTAAQQSKLDWIASQPGLQAFRDRAAAAALTPLENNFDPCG